MKGAGCSWGIYVRIRANLPKDALISYHPPLEIVALPVVGVVRYHYQSRQQDMPAV